MYQQFLSYTVLTVITADLLATSGDITMTWTSPMLPKLYSNNSEINPFDRPITTKEDSWIGSLINVGAMIGPLPFGFIAERFGRKVGLLAIAIPHIISYLLLAFSKTVGIYYFARFLGGLAVGGSYTLLPIYVAEISQDSNRGMLSASLNVFWTLGNLIPYIIGPYTSVMWFNIILAFVPISFFTLFLFIAPESPYYLLVKRKPDLAEQSLIKLRSGNATRVKTELQQIIFEIDQNKSQITFTEFIRTKTHLKGLAISLVLVMTQQLSGINAVLFYTQEIFQAAGANGLHPEVSSIIIGLVIFFSSFLTPFVVDQWGRKFLMIVSLIGTCFAHLAFGVYFYLKNLEGFDAVLKISWVPIMSLIIFVVTFNLGLGSLPFAISAELFPTNVKSYTATLSSCVCWTTSFFVTRFFNDLQDTIGEGETFWLFGSFCFLTLIFTLLYLPETKGKSFQEIQNILRR